MHILLTDLLTCPRCGPGFGLVVLADSLADRNVLEGVLGCANCRNEYPIRHGVADLRIGGASLPMEAPPSPDGPDLERAFRVGALLAVGDRSGAVMIHGADVRTVAEIARLLPNAQVFGSSYVPPAESASGQVGWVVHGTEIPLRDRALIAAAFIGAGAADLIPSASRTVVPGGHVVLEGLAPEALLRDPAQGWSVLLEQDGVAVASRPVAG